MCDCYPGGPCEGHYHAHPLALRDAAPDLARLYLRELDVYPSQEIIDPADFACWLALRSLPAGLVLEEALATALASWHTQDCQACIDWEATAYSDETRRSCETCDLEGWVNIDAPRMLLDHDGDVLVCVRCWDLRHEWVTVGEHDSQCAHGHGLILRRGVSLEALLSISTERAAANDQEGASA